jgi:hypothetical protein
MEETGQAAADPECAVGCDGDAAHLALDEGFVEGDLCPSIFCQTIEVMVGEKPECAVGAFRCVCEAVGCSERILNFLCDVRDGWISDDVEPFARHKPDALGGVGEESCYGRKFCDLSESLGDGVGAKKMAVDIDEP